jgi:hypothetical protein
MDFKHALLSAVWAVITGFTVIATNHDEAEGVFECLSEQKGLLEGDKGFICPILKEDLAHNIQIPLRRNMKDSQSRTYVTELMRDRRLVETIIGQLTDQFKIQKLRARDKWHLTVRMTRKILSHTNGCFFERINGEITFAYC